MNEYTVILNDNRTYIVKNIIRVAINERINCVVFYGPGDIVDDVYYGVSRVVRNPPRDKY